MYGGHTYGESEYGGDEGELFILSPLVDSIAVSDSYELEVITGIDSADVGPGVSDQAFIQVDNYALLINGIDRSLQVVFGSVKIRENVNQLVNTLTFSMLKYGSRAYAPAEGDEVELFDPDGVLVFAGTLNEADRSYAGDVLQYDLTFVSWEAEFAARVVFERYTSTTGNAILADLLTKYAPGYTAAHIDADFPVETFVLNGVSLSAAIQKLATNSNYSWYVDYTKGVHFFPHYAEPTPFNLTDGDGNFGFESLSITDDFSQIKNRIFVRGGQIPGALRTESYTADGEQLQFPLANQFATLPAVVVLGGFGESGESGLEPVSVGVDGLDAEEDFDAFWSYQQKYLRFKDDTKPDPGAIVRITGNPQYRLILQIDDAASIDRLGGDPAGVREFLLADDSIKSSDQAKALAQAELEAYSSGIVGGSFTTNRTGIHPGQLIIINSPSRETSGEFVVQSVSMKMLTRKVAEFAITIATLRTLGILDILIEQIRSGSRIIDDSDTEVLERFFQQNESLGISESIQRDTDSQTDEDLSITEEVARAAGEPVYVFAPYHTTDVSTDLKVKAIFGKAKFSA